ncbi:MAG: AraC family transcriptional regulator [Halioglobus sp.]
MAPVDTITGQYGSIAELSHELSSLAWPADFRQLDCGTGQAGFEALMTDDAIVQGIFLERRTQQFFCAPEGLQSYGLPSGRVAFTSVPKQPAKPNDLLLRMEAGSGVEAISEPGFSAFTLSFGKHRISELAENLGLPDPGGTKDSRGLELFNDPILLSPLRATLCQLFESRRDEKLSYAGKSALHETIKSEIPAMLLVATSASQPKNRPSLRNRERVLKRALEFIKEHPQEALSVERLCVASASSMSTLERAFLDRYSMSPKRYTLVKRLHHVHKALLRQAETGKVAIYEVANDWGFWHMGKFAADYKKLFGYLPSQTAKSEQKK